MISRSFSIRSTSSDLPVSSSLGSFSSCAAVARSLAVPGSFAGGGAAVAAFTVVSLGCSSCTAVATGLVFSTFFLSRNMRTMAATRLNTPMMMLAAKFQPRLR